MEGYDLEAYRARCEAFGWRAFVVDGHNVAELVDVFERARISHTGQPTMIIAKTIKGHGIASIEGKQGYHGKAFTKEELPSVLQELKLRFPHAAAMHGKGPHRAVVIENHRPEIVSLAIPEPTYTIGDLVATRKAYGTALTMVGAELPTIIALDAEVKNSTFAETFEHAFPERFVQCFIAEQTMVGMGIGFASQGKIPFISTFGAFFSRAHDQIRMAAIGQAALRLVGSHAGVSIGEDGPSQMALEDIALMRSLANSIVLYPSDAVSTTKLVARMAQYTQGISYLRTTRAATPVLYNNAEDFVIGGSKILKSSKKDDVCIIAAGITLHQALKAYDMLAQENIFATVIDCYSVKPLDVDTIRQAARNAKNRIITVEDHYREGGLGEALAYELRNDNIYIEVLAVTKLPRSGSPDELLSYEGIDAHTIAKVARTLCNQHRHVI
jgi:transketolase